MQPFGASSSSFGLGLHTGESSDFPMDLEGVSSLDTVMSNGKGKQKAGVDLDDRLASKARTLGGDRVRENVPVREQGCGRRVRA